MVAEGLAVSGTEQNLPEPTSYVVVMRAAAGFYFGRDDPLPPMRFPTELGPVEFSFGTLRALLPGFHNPIRRGVWAEARGEAPSLAVAVETFANFARGVVAVLSVTANAPVSDLTADLVYDITPGRREREYWRRNLPDNPLIPNRGRRLASALALAVVGAWMQHLARDVREVERWNRCFVNYHHALQSWEPGLEVPAMGYLWMGMEALTPIALRNLLEEEGISREELAGRWDVELRALDAEMRRRILFRGDDECYSQAREARNGHQHGYRALWDVRSRAMEVRDRTADYLRTGIIDMVGLEPEVRATLLGHPFDRPFFWSVITQLHGHLIGDVDDPAHPDDIYPRVDWQPVPIETPPDDEGDAGIGFELWVDPHLADGVSFVPDGITMLHPKDDEPPI